MAVVAADAACSATANPAVVAKSASTTPTCNKEFLRFVMNGTLVTAAIRDTSPNRKRTLLSAGADFTMDYVRVARESCSLEPSYVVYRLTHTRTAGPFRPAGM